MNGIFTKILALFTGIAVFFCNLFGILTYPSGEKLDMSKFTLTFADEFDGNLLNPDIWSGHYVWGKTEVRRGGYWNEKMASVADGYLTITTAYLENGAEPGDKAGYYNYGLDTAPRDGKTGFEQKYGYFEVRCKLPKGSGIWAAFWLLCDGVYDEANGGRTGAELDVFESPYYNSFINNTVSSNIHIDGYNDFHKNLGAQKYIVRGNPYEEFNTYGVEWNSKEYIFYINGTETFRTDYGGVSESPEWLILSVETDGNNAVPSQNIIEGFEKTEYVIDYVRAYQYK